MGRLIFGMALLSALSVPSFASNWVSVGEGGNGQFLISVDLDSLQEKGPYRTVVEKFSYLRPAKYTGGRLIYAIKSYQSYNCQQRSTLLLHGFAYSDVAATAAIATINYTNIPANYAVVAPNSVEDKIFNLVCDQASVSWAQ